MLLLRRNLILSILLLEILGFLVIFFVSHHYLNSLTTDFMVILFFSILVIEGVIALRGLISLVRFSGRDYIGLRVSVNS